MIASKFFRFSLVLGLLPSLLHAADLPKQFTLGKYIPEDYWMYVHGVHNPEAEWIESKYLELFQGLKNTGIDKDIKGLIVSFLQDEQKAQFEAILTKVIDLLGGVCWSDLFTQEMAIGERLYPGTQGNEFGYEYVFLTRGKPESTEKNLAGLVAILKEFKTYFPDMKLENTTKDGVEQWLVPIGPEKSPVFQIALVRKGDVIGLILGNPSVPVVTAMLAGKSETKSILSSPKFTEALKNVPTPENSVAYFDLKTFMKGLDGLMTKAIVSADNAEEEKQAKEIFGRVIQAIDFVDYSITTEETDGNRSLTHGYTKLQDLQKPSAVAKCFFDRKPFEKFDKYIPAEATSFTVDTFVDLEYLYKTIIEFIESTGTEGKEGIKELNQQFAQLGFDPQRDLFSWWSGELINYEMPAAVITPMSPSDTVMMIRVKDSQLASQKINSFLQMVSGVMAQQGQGLVVKPADVGTEGFNEVIYPPIAMFAKPVVGVTGEWLMVASSSGAVKKSLAVSTGNAPSIVKNERYMKEGIIPKGPVISASFADTSNTGQDLAAMFGSFGFIGAMMSAGIPDNTTESKIMKDFIQKSTSILAKLAPVVAKLDFFSSESSVMTKEGLVIRTENVTTYKPESMSKARTAKAETPEK